MAQSLPARCPVQAWPSSVRHKGGKPGKPELRLLGTGRSRLKGRADRHVLNHLSTCKLVFPAPCPYTPGPHPGSLAPLPNTDSPSGSRLQCYLLSKAIYGRECTKSLPKACSRLLLYHTWALAHWHIVPSFMRLHSAWEQR